MKNKQYIRNKKGQLVGVMVAVSNESQFAIGYSIAAVSKGDKFDRELGEGIANARAIRTLHDGIIYDGIPKFAEKQIVQFASKSDVYFDHQKQLVNDNIMGLAIRLAQKEERKERNKAIHEVNEKQVLESI